MAEFTFRDQAKPDETWQDAEGTLITPNPFGSGWFAFGTSRVIEESDPAMVFPLTRITDDKGVQVAPLIPYPEQKD